MWQSQMQPDSYCSILWEDAILYELLQVFSPSQGLGANPRDLCCFALLCGFVLGKKKKFGMYSRSLRAAFCMVEGPFGLAASWSHTAKLSANCVTSCSLQMKESVLLLIHFQLYLIWIITISLRADKPVYFRNFILTWDDLNFHR